MAPKHEPPPPTEPASHDEPDPSRAHEVEVEVEQISERAAADLRSQALRVLSLRWVPLTAAFLSLILSVASIYVSTRQPELLVVVPDQVRVSQGRDGGAAYIYLQPAFLSTGVNNRVEAIRTMQVDVSAPAGAVVSPVTLAWDEVGRLVPDPATQVLSYQYVADPVPLLVSPQAAASPLCLFVAPRGWFFVPGTYTFTLVAQRVIASDPLRASFHVTLTADQVAFLDGPGAHQFLALPIN